MNFDKIIKRSENYNKYNNNEYLTYSQLASKVENYADRINDLKLQNLSKDFQIIAYRNKLTLYKRFNVLLANEDVDRVNVRRVQIDQLLVQSALIITGFIIWSNITKTNIHSILQTA